jgi:cephalosporin-C deacetylase
VSKTSDVVRGAVWALGALVSTALAQTPAPASVAAPAPAIHPASYKPCSADGIYALGEKVCWTVTPVANAAGTFNYVIRSNNLVEIGRGTLDLAKPSTIETTLGEPGMVYVDISSAEPNTKPHALGAAIAPERIARAQPEPKDFDAFWRAKIKQLRQVPVNAELTSKPAGKDGIDYATIKMNHLDGRHVQGQIARPALESKSGGKAKLPGLVIFQWASPPYPLQKSWVVDRAAEGWLALNIEPHDVTPDAPKEYYDALPQELKQYNRIETKNRDKNYFVQMYLAGIRAIDYLASRPDWDGKTLVVTGTSMGGQQSLCAAGLHPKVTGLVVHVPAGADLNGTAHGRKIGYPNFDPNNPAEMITAQYVDSANCAARIQAPSLVSMGFIDTVTPPVGIWAAYNGIRGPKEVAPLFEAPHNHQATVEQQALYTQRSADWLRAFVAGRSPAPRADVATPRTDENSRIAHQELLEKRSKGKIDLYFLGDSITRRWGTSDALWSALYANWRENFLGWNAGNFGWGADKTQHMLWRLQNGELDGVNPKVIVIMAGTNNVGRATPLGDTAAQIADISRGVIAVVREARKRAPQATVVLMGITPRNDNPRVMPVIDGVNARLAKFADGKRVRYININRQLADADGRLLPGMTNDLLHLDVPGYQIWADALKPVLTELLGPRKDTDAAPPPTGDPSIRAKTP